MKLTKEQKFLYTRVTILVASVGWIAFAFAGLKGFPFWYGGFVVCFWIAFGLLNFPHRTSLWLLVHRKMPFLVFYAALAGSLVLLDQLALRFLLWFYPFYHGLWFIWVYAVLYPIAALAQLELFYFLAGAFKEKLTFVRHSASRGHHIIDGIEGILFLLMILLFLLGAALYPISLLVLFLVSISWIVAATVKLSFHIKHPEHTILILICAGVLAALLNELPNTLAFEWVYLEAPLLNAVFFGVPLWVWLGWYWYAIFTLRLWIFLVLHPRIK